MRYHQVIMTLDIFQYSNMYTLRKNVQWVADEPHVKDECGPYVTKPGKSRAWFHTPVLNVRQESRSRTGPSCYISTLG